MNGWSKFIRQTTRFIKNHGADILSILAGIGVVATGVSAYNAGKKAILSDDGSSEPQTGKILLQPLLFGAGTIGCIGAARYYGRKTEKKMAAALSLYSAYAIRQQCERGRSEQANTGDQTHNNGTVQERDWSDVEDTGTGDIIFRETFTGRQFKASMGVYEYAIRKLQDNFSVCGFATLNDFYGLLGIDESLAGEVLGWTLDQTILDPDYEIGADIYYDEALTTLAIQLQKVNDNMYDIHYNILPIGSLAGIGPCNY